MFEAAKINHDRIAVDAIVAETGGQERHVIAILQAIQDRFSYLPQEALRRVCEITEISAAQIMSVATFYSQFRLEPAGRHSVKVCIGTACHVMGAENIVDALYTHLDIPEGADTDPDRLFTVERVACLGCCMLAPAVQIDDLTYGFVRPDTVPEMLQDFLATAEGSESVTGGVSPDHAVVGEVRICLCSSCVASGAQKIHAEVARLMKHLGLPARIKVVGCTGMAYRAPLVEILMEDGSSFRYGQVSPESIENILLHHLRPARLATRLRAKAGAWLDRLLTDEHWEPVTRFLLDNAEGPDASFSNPQRHIVTADCGCLTPLDIDEYCRHQGFDAARMAFDDLT
ncbi:MAG: proton-conducting membrane transporter, partial [bacterium]|nr:proton-conducting membrane transporter [bacterium]